MRNNFANLKDLIVQNQDLIQRFFIFFNLALLAALTVFGSHFSKHQILGSIYLHDLLLGAGSFFSLILVTKRFPYRPILIILAISFLYLVYSFHHYSTSASLIIRQFALFGYLGCYYILNRNNQPDYFKIIEKFLIGLSIASIVLQSISVGGHILDGTFNPADSNNHYWYSQMVIVGLIMSSAMVLLFQKNTILKSGSWVSVFILSWSTGHASAQLSILGILIAYFILRLTAWRKLIPLLLGSIISLILVNKAPQFNDKNTAWRLLTWDYILSDLIKNDYGVIGKGFGAPYTNSELEIYLFDKISSTALQERGRPDERFISPPHNSFITMCFAIGILPALLIFIPYLKIFQPLIQPFDRNKKFYYLIMLSLIGLTIWSSFNVVLELPHSAGFFWLIYFTFWRLSSNSSLFRTFDVSQ